MLFPLVVLGFVIASGLAGEVEKTGYAPKNHFSCYRTSTKSDARRLKIKTTPKGHEFFLDIDYWRYRHWGEGFMRSKSSTSYDYQNIVRVYYDDYLLDKLKVPKIDELEEDPLSAIDDNIVKSIIPEVQEENVLSNTITVYYSFTNGDCVRGIYSFGPYYEKSADDIIVDQSKCSVTN